jgi:hypothetical protein
MISAQASFRSVNFQGNKGFMEDSEQSKKFFHEVVAHSFVVNSRSRYPGQKTLLELGETT